MMKRIFVALDASQRASLVLSAAASLATLSAAKLVLFRAVGLPPEVPRELLDATDLTVEDIMRRNAHADLSRMAAELAPGLVEAVVVDMCIPWDGICRAAREQEVDLIAIGSHGYGGLDRVLGTTAGKVVNHADRNVFVVRTVL